MASIRWSNIEGQQASQFYLGDMYQFEYETEVADFYFDAFPLVFVLRRNLKNKTTGEKYFEGVNFHYYDLPKRIELFRSMSRFFTNKVITDEEDDDDDVDEVIKEIIDVKTTSKTLAARLELTSDRDKDPLAEAMSKIPEDTFLKAREYRNIIMISRKHRAGKLAWRRYSAKKIISKVVRVPPSKWYEAVVERSQRFFTSNMGKIKGQRVWKEQLIKLRRS